MPTHAPRRPALALAAALALLFVVPVARAATPASGSVSEAQPSVTWSGGPLPPTGSATCNGPNDPACDNFKLTINAPEEASVWTVTVTVTPLALDDWDLEVYDPAGNLVGDSGNNPGQVEVVVLISPATGLYTVAAAPFAGATYTGQAVLDVPAPPPPPPPGGSLRYTVHVDPAGHQYGEPNLGINWRSETDENGGSGMYISGLQTLRVRFDECTSPARLLERDGNGQPAWIDVSPLSHVTSLDPIIFTDPVTGTTFSSQLAGKTSLLESSGDDGETWLQCDGAGINSGVDHQTIGGGPLAPPLSGGTPLYPHGLYYCSQDVAVAQCAVSLDGCRTFGPANPIYHLLECGGLHGHVKVSPDGVAYVPNKSCLGQQGVAVSEDNGLTWDVRVVPGSVAGAWDPSVGIGADNKSATSPGDAAHTIYFGFSDGDGSPMIATSDDRGQTWSVPVDVGAAFGLQDSAFPSVVAGDRDRAVFAFLGTTTQGSVGDNPNLPAVWHLYVATTFDRGGNWETIRATGDDPVQRGTICDGGFTGCGNGTRNLLDFMDVQLDATGRPWVSYADGCVGACVTNPAVNTLAAVSAIARQVAGRGLLSAFDAPPGPPASPRVSATLTGADVDLRWDEPNPNGDPITAYKVYRTTDESGGQQLLATLGPGARRYTDVGGAGESNPRYEVRAVNSLGESSPRFPHCQLEVGPGASTFDPGDACTLRGETIAQDPAGDQTGTAPTQAHDILRTAISEFPEDVDADTVVDEKLFTVLEVDDLSTLPGNGIWRVEWVAPNGTVYFTSMATDELALAVSFSYGWLDTSTGSIYRTVGDAESGTFDAGGTIRVVVRRSTFDTIDVTGDGTPDPTGMIPGAILSSVTGSTNTLLGAGGTGLLETNDETVPDAYTLRGNASCLNRAPVAVSDSATTVPDTAVQIDVLANDSDPDGDPISLLDAGPATSGSVVIVGTADGPVVEYTPAPGFVGTDDFEYTIGDDQGNTATGEVTVTVSGGGGNQPPDAQGDSATTEAGRSVRIAVLANDSDPDGDTLTVTAVSQPANGSSANNPDGSVTYTPDDGFVGNDSFSYSISDGQGGTDSAGVTVTVTESACELPGITVITDPAGDNTDPTDDPSLDLRRISAAEPSASDPSLPPGMIAPLVVELELRDFTTPNPSAAWRAVWTSPDGLQHWVGAETCDPVAGFSCTYGTFDGTLFTAEGDAAACESFADGRIRITVEKSLVGVDESTDVGEALNGFAGNVQLFVGAACTGLLSTVDSGGPGAYVLRGNMACDDLCPFDPNKTEPGACGCGVVDDGDGDGRLACGVNADCNDADDEAWATPGEVRQLLLGHDRQTGVSTLQWMAPAQPGGSVVLYDTLRSDAPTGFFAGSCLETDDGSDLVAEDAETPTEGEVFYYLARGGNSCAEGGLGQQSDGTPREGVACE